MTVCRLCGGTGQVAIARIVVAQRDGTEVQRPVFGKAIDAYPACAALAEEEYRCATAERMAVE